MLNLFMSGTARPFKMPKGLRPWIVGLVCHATGPNAPPSVEPNPPMPARMYVEFWREKESNTCASSETGGALPTGALICPGRLGFAKLGAFGSTTNFGTGHVGQLEGKPRATPRRVPG